MEFIQKENKCFQSFIRNEGGRAGRWPLGRGLKLRRCRKKGRGKVHRELEFGVDGRRVTKKWTGWARNSGIHLEFQYRNC